jgi:PKD domain
MRRRPIILCFLAAAFLAGVPGALADPPATTVGVKALGESPDAQIGPTVAVNPVVSASAAAVALGTDWRLGLFQPQTGDASGTIQGTTGATTWSDNGLMPSSTSSPPAVSGGSPDVVWGTGNNVYAVELGRDSTDQTNPCSSTAGLYLSISTNGGTSWAPPFELVQDNANQTVSDPSIAYSAVTGRIYVAYTINEPCSNSSTTEIDLVSIKPDLSNRGLQRISPAAATPAFEHPAVAALPSGDVAVAYYDDSTGPGQVLVTTCTPDNPADVTSAPDCSPTANVVDGAVTEPAGAISPLTVDVRPAIAADPTTNRLVVAWNETTGISASDVFSSTSLDGGDTFGPLVQVNATTGSQFDPELAMAPDGRVDLAYFDSEFSPGTGYEIAVSASNRPSPGTPFETWSASQSLESSRIVPKQPYIPGSFDLGSRIGLAEIPRALPNRAWTLVAWPNTDNATGSNPQNIDIYSSVLLHQSTTPVATPFPSPQPVSKNTLNTVQFGSRVTDADADPLTYSIVSQSSLGTSSIADSNIPTLTYTGTQAVGGDSVTIGISDGVNQTTLTIALSVQNDPPKITCSSLETPYNKPIQIAALSQCWSDKNGDSVTLSALNPVNGTLTGSGSTLEFVPTTDFKGIASVWLVANDGQLSSAPQQVSITVDPPKAIAVSIVPSAPRSARTDQPITFKAASLDPDADTSEVTWTFSDGTPADHGRSISHLFAKVGTYTVWAQIGDGPRASVQVIAQKPPLIVRDTSLLHRKTLKLQLQLAYAGKLVVKLSGVPGHHTFSAKMKHGAHSVRMLLPASVRRRGTIVVTLALSLPTGGTEHLRRAIMLVRD